jgi:hypothetical protein
MLSQDIITFGKFNGKHINEMIRDRGYIKWITTQPWLPERYPYIYKYITEYKPFEHLCQSDEDKTVTDFVHTYKIFNLKKPEDVTIFDTHGKDTDIICYRYYLSIVEILRGKIIERLEKSMENPYDIKFSECWLVNFTNETNLQKYVFSEFIKAYELLPVTTIIKNIKYQGGIQYSRDIGFKIAKERSIEQENWWKNVLIGFYHEKDINTQYKYKNCIFDFIHIQKNIIFECKLGLKDFNNSQYVKYTLILNKYKIIYLISNDCLINIEQNILVTTNVDKYQLYIEKIKKAKHCSYLDLMLFDFILIEADTAIEMLEYVD